MGQAFSFNPVQADVSDLLEIKKRVARFTLRDTNKKAFVGFGQAKSPFKSKGLDFQEVRVYQPGDDIRQIDWRVTAKYGKPFTKLYTDEKERQVFLICDMRSGMKFASRGAFKSVWCARIAAMIAFLAQNRQDRLGFGILTAQAFESGNLFGAKEILNGLLRRLSAVSDPNDLKEDTFSLTGALQKADPFIKSGSLIFILSDFSDWDQGAENILGRWVQKSTCGLIHIYDPLEKTFPKGFFPISDGKEIYALNASDTRFLKAFNDLFEKREKALRASASRLNIGYAQVQTDEDALLKIFLHYIGEKNGARY